jgi:hypothetical protein
MKTLFDYAEGQRLRDCGTQTALQNPYDAYTARCRALALDVVRQQGTVCSDDIQRLMPRPQWIKPASVGAMWLSLVKSKELKLTGYVQSQRTDRRAGKQGVYVLGDKYDPKVN